MVPKKNLTSLPALILVLLLMISYGTKAAGSRPLLTNFTYTTTCSNQEVEFIITDDITTIDSVKWYFIDPPAAPADSSDEIEDATYIYPAAGTYTVTLKVYRGGVEDITITTIEITDPVVFDMGPDLTLCENGTTVLTVPEIPGATYTWYYLEDTVPGTHEFTVTEMATYHVAINGCRINDSVNVFYSPIPDFDLGPDRTMCTGELLTLDATAQNATYLWNTGETTPTIVATDPGGTYSVDATIPGCGVFSDQVTINFAGTPYPFSLGPDTLLCPGESVVLDALRPEGTAYQWTHGPTSPRVTVSRNGDFAVFVTINGTCDVLDTIGVRYSRLRDFSLGNDTTLCYPDFLVLSADHGTGNYLWQDGSDQATYHVDSTGYYSVRVQIGRCVEFDTIRVDFQDTLRVTLGEDSTLCFGETLVLTPRGAGMDFKWQDSTSVPTFTVSQPGIYAIVANNVCGRATDSVNIYYQDCNCSMFFPTAFTPNGDGLNDVFRPRYRCILGQYRLSIYNRWGEFIFFTSDPGVAWNGKHKNIPADIGTYVWIVEYEDALNARSYKKQGTVTLIR